MTNCFSGTKYLADRGAFGLRIFEVEDYPIACWYVKITIAGQGPWYYP